MWRLSGRVGVTGAASGITVATARLADERTGSDPDVVVEHVVDGIRDDRFHVLPAQPELLAPVDARMQTIIDRRDP